MGHGACVGSSSCTLAREVKFGARITNFVEGVEATNDTPRLWVIVLEEPRAPPTGLTSPFSVSWATDP